MCSLGVCTDSQAKKYISAITNPFSKEAIGAQVPDNYSFPTETRFIKCDLKLKSDSAGNLDFSLLPNLFQSILTGCPIATGSQNTNVHIGALSTDTNFQSSGGVPNPGLNSNNGSWNLGGVTVPFQLNTQMTQYRIVGWGARIRALTAPLVQSGRLLFASAPSNNTVLFKPNVGASPGSTTYDDVCTFLKLPSPDYDGYLTNEMLNVPDAMECMYSDLSLQGGMEWVSKPTSSESVIFRSTDNSNVDYDGTNLGFGLSDNAGSSTVTFLTDGNDYQIARPGHITVYDPNNNTIVGTGNVVEPHDTGLVHICRAIVSVIPIPNNLPVTGFSIQQTGAVVVISQGHCSVAPTNLQGGFPLVGYAWKKLATSGANQNYDMASLASSVSGPFGGFVTSVRQVTTAAASITIEIGISNIFGTTFSVGDSVLFIPMTHHNNISYPMKSLYRSDNPDNYTNPARNVNGYSLYEENSIILGNDPSTTKDLAIKSDLVDPAFIASGGWSQMFCRGFGLPPSAPCLSVELCYHIEGPPVISSEIGGLVAGGQFPYVDKSLMDAALEYGSRRPHFQTIKGANSGNVLSQIALGG